MLQYSIQTLPVAEMPFPAPLDEAVTENVYNEFILTPPPTPVDEEAEAQSLRDQESRAALSAQGQHNSLTFYFSSLRLGNFQIRRKKKMKY